MRYYETFLNWGCFYFSDVKKLIKSQKRTEELLGEYVKKGYIASVKKGMYVALDLVSRDPVSNKFVLATKMTEDAVVTHHSAMEYHGYANQVSYRVTVSSDCRMNDVDFDGITYHRYIKGVDAGVSVDANGVRVTDIERTLLDCINDFEKDMGFEELIQCVSSIPVLDAEKLLTYLTLYDKCFLNQKVGFILEHFKDDFDLEDAFFEQCHKHCGKSSRYLLKDMSREHVAFSGKWHITYPADLWGQTMNGGYENAEV